MKSGIWLSEEIAAAVFRVEKSVMLEAVRSFEKSANTHTIRRQTPESGPFTLEYSHTPWP